MNHQPLLAMADFTEVLKLKPDDAAALLARGQLRLAIKDEAGARDDFAQVLKLAPALGARVADAYVHGGFFDDAIAEYDRWIDAYPKNEDAAPAYSGRCWARTLANRDLDKARADCDQALRLRPDDPTSLERRGLAHLRLAEYDPAIADFDAALRIDPKTAWSLYGRGVAELRKGLKDQGDADLAAAAEIAPRLPERAKEYGLTP
jgi:tetratricopeptide (TPR) repeat protein